MTDPRPSQLVLRVPEDLPSPFDQIRSSVVGAVTGFQLPSDCKIFDKLNNDALNEPQRYALFLDCLTEVAGDIRAENAALQRQINELALTRSPSISQPTVASDVEQSSDRTGHILSISRMAEGLSKALTFYEKGSHFPSWRQGVEPICARYTPALPQCDQVSVLRTKIGRLASKSVEANTEVQNAKTTVELLDALEKVFKPRDIERTRAINSIVQAAKDSAASIVQKVKQAYTQYNSAYPSDADDILQIVQTCFLPHVRQFLTTELQLILGRSQAITISDLENVAEAWDEHSRAMAAQNRAHSSHPMQKRARASQSANAFDASAELDDDAMSSVSVSQSRGRGGGRGGHKGRGRGGGGRGGGFRESYPQGGQGQGPAPSANNVSLSGNAGKEHVQLPSSTTAVNASNLRQRPRMPEAEVRAPEQSTSTGFRSRFGMPNLRTGRDALSSANVCMPLRSFVDMVSDPACRTACQPLHDYLTASGDVVTSSDTQASSTAVHTVTASVDEIAPSYCDVARPIDDVAPLPCAGAIIGAAVTPSVQVVRAPRPVVDLYTVSMPYVHAKFCAGRNGSMVRDLYLDTGASISCISQEAFNRDHALLKGAGGKVIKLQEPMRLDMFNKSGSVVTEIVMGAEFQIGDALYTGHFFVVRDVGYDYLLGSDFMARYAVKPLYYRSLLELGCAKGATNKRPRSYQRVRMFFTGRNMRLAVKGPSILR